MPYDVQDFQADVLEASREHPVVVDFWAAWCGPCRILGPILEKLAAESGDRWHLAKLDTERFPDVAARYGIRSIPNVKLFVDGQPVDEFVGALPEHAVREWLDRAIPSDADRAVAAALAEAGRLADGGRIADARAKLESALEASPTDPRLRLELARLVVFDDPARARELLEHLEPEAGDREMVDAIRHFAGILGTETAKASEDPAARRWSDALERLQTRDFEGAFEALLGILREDSGEARDEAGKTCVALFHYLGPSDPLVSRYRGQVANALYR